MVNVGARRKGPPQTRVSVEGKRMTRRALVWQQLLMQTRLAPKQVCGRRQVNGEVKTGYGQERVGLKALDLS